MKKIFLLASILLVTVVLSQRTEVGKLQLNTGLFLRSGEGLYAGIDYSIYPDITIGVQFDYAGGYEKKEFPDYEIATIITQKAYSTTIGISANGNYHFNTILNIPNTWDIYAGLSLVYETGTTNKYYQNVPDGFQYKYENTTEPHNYKPLPVCQIGGRYFFTDNLGINLEMGFRKLGFAKKLGITYKF